MHPALLSTVSPAILGQFECRQHALKQVVNMPSCAGEPAKSCCRRPCCARQQQYRRQRQQRDHRQLDQAADHGGQLSTLLLTRMLHANCVVPLSRIKSILSAGCLWPDMSYEGVTEFLCCPHLKYTYRALGDLRM
jgi:hypothetical protein